MSEYAVVAPPHQSGWATGHDQPQFYTELLDGREGLTGPMGMVGDDKQFRGGKRWEGHSKSGIICTLELLHEDKVEVCRARRVESFWTCCVIAGHDGPHIPITDELRNFQPKGFVYVITEMKRHG